MVIMMTHPEGKKKGKLPYQPSKLGRKGDPRMHAAMKARLINNKLSLYDALKKGGFRFYSKPDGSVVDADNVSLSQRKNQLSRRIRLHKKQNHLEDGDDTAGGEGVSVSSNTSYCNGSSTNGDDIQGSTCAAHGRIGQGTYDVAYANNFKNVCVPATELALSRTNNEDDTNLSNHEFENEHISKGSTAMNRSKKRTRMSSFSSDVGQFDDPRLGLAIDNFRSEIAALFKKSMINAGYNSSETDECDQAYMTFVEKALLEETSRIQRMRSAMNRESLTAVKSEQGYVDERSHEHQKTNQCSHDHDAAYPKYGGPNSERKCLHSRHFHRLEGKCGHQAIVHKPPGGNPHIDFVVNDKVECYEGCNPMMDYSAFWPSSYSVEEGAAFGLAPMEDLKEPLKSEKEQQHRSEQILYDEQQRDHMQCLGDNCKPPPNDPKIFDLKDIEFGAEWSKIFSEDDSSKSDEAALGTLFSMQKHSEI